MFNNLEKYKENLRIEGNKVISHVTHVATIDLENSKLYVHGYWSRTTSKHINYVASQLGLEIEKKKEEEVDAGFGKMVSSVMALGNIFSDTKEQANDWKLRMLKAGYDTKGLDIPEDEKEVRLNKIIASLKSDGGDK